MIHLDSYFSNGMVQPPTRENFGCLGRSLSHLSPFNCLINATVAGADVDTIEKAIDWEPRVFDGNGEAVNAGAERCVFFFNPYYFLPETDQLKLGIFAQDWDSH